MLLGCIADDFTGGTDLANVLCQQGMRTVQAIGLPEAPLDGVDAVVVALKTRTIAKEDAVSQSLSACRQLVASGARQIYFKYCSTFDSTEKGNIGPVADALLDELQCGITIVCPAFPENGRTIYVGHLFVGNVLLSNSGMRNHPLTPMTNSNLVDVMAQQSRYKVANMPYAVVRQGVGAIQNAIARLRDEGVCYVVVDALDNADLLALGTAAQDMKLITGGSGAALGLPGNFLRAGLLGKQPGAYKLLELGGPAIVLSGSCSEATMRQVETFKSVAPSRALNVDALVENNGREVSEIVMWARQQTQPALIYSTASPSRVQGFQKKFGQGAGELIENSLASIAMQLAEKGYRRFVVAGGETSGAVTKALDVKILDIGAQIAPGVPATQSRGSRRFSLVLKSGNFGGPDFFNEALAAIR